MYVTSLIQVKQEFSAILSVLWYGIFLSFRPDPIRIQSFNDQKLKKKYSWKKFNFFGSKTTIYLSLGLHKERPSYRRSIQLLKENIQHFKTWNFSIFSYILWVIVAFHLGKFAQPRILKIFSRDLFLKKLHLELDLWDDVEDLVPAGLGEVGQQRWQRALTQQGQELSISK